MSVVSFQVRPPSEQERRQAGFKLQKVIRPRRGGETVYVGHGAPAGGSGAGAKPRFAMYRDLAGRETLGFVVRPVGGQSSGGRLSVLGPAGEELGELGTPAKSARWRPRWEIRLPGDRVLAGHGGTLTSWVVFLLLSPLWLVLNLFWAVGGTGDSAWSLPVRTAWRQGVGSPAALKYHGMSERYKVRTDRLDVRLAYAQAVVHRSQGTA
ncbi:hypothetical protein [Actinacidiphila glaucinigra]|uniref:Uncharacterized protein n=1 Tax=Actinacidiphila glaucinigra TaxID=235986 RepID=A0A239NL96_9ACTN|nr:hypothetical protein [Actinacidiphila glaucinigra]SNT54899.1 hypothetical protein SAMN05216252_13834 [Actinacidiphila glaucinigra]